MAYYTASDFPATNWNNLQGYTPRTLPTWVPRADPLKDLWDDDDETDDSTTATDVIPNSDKANDIAAGRIHHTGMYDADDMWVGAEGTGYGMVDGVMTEVNPAGNKQWGGTDYSVLSERAKKEDSWSNKFWGLLENNNVAKLTRFLNTPTTKQNLVTTPTTHSLTVPDETPLLDAYRAALIPTDYTSALYPGDTGYMPDEMGDESMMTRAKGYGYPSYTGGLLEGDMDQVVSSLLSDYAIENAIPNATGYVPDNYVELAYKNAPSETAGWARYNAAQERKDIIEDDYMTEFDWAGSSPVVEVDTGAVDDDENDDAYAGMLAGD